MTGGVGIWRCRACGTGSFPEPLLCPRCHNADFLPDRVAEGVVEEVTVVHHMLGHSDWQPRRLASVCTENGPRITVGLKDESEPGSVIELWQEGNAPFGRGKRAS